MDVGSGAQHEKGSEKWRLYDFRRIGSRGGRFIFLVTSNATKNCKNIKLVTSRRLQGLPWCEKPTSNQKSHSQFLVMPRVPVPSVSQRLESQPTALTWVDSATQYRTHQLRGKHSRVLGQCICQAECAVLLGGEPHASASSSTPPMSLHMDRVVYVCVRLLWTLARVCKGAPALHA